MKILNEPIKVMAIFNADGKVEPVKFRLDDQVVMVQRIMKTYEEKVAGIDKVIFVCLQNGKDIYELKYEIKKNMWYLYKK